MSRNGIPDGGRYTRPRRGFRAKSHYRDRLRKRGVSPKDVHMESLYVLRDRQGYIPGPTDSASSKRRTNKTLRRRFSGVQMPPRMREMASDNEGGSRNENQTMEQHRYAKSKKGIR